MPRSEERSDEFYASSLRSSFPSFAPRFRDSLLVVSQIAQRTVIVLKSNSLRQQVLALYATNRTDREALLRMGSKEGKEEYKTKIESQHVGVAKLITKFVPSIKTTLPQFIAFCPRLIPRMYTISSSSSVHPNDLAMTVSVIKEKCDDGSVFSGVCSNHLANSKSCRVFVRPSTFRLPKSVATPIIMVGPGTGVAPMRALLQEREYQSKNGDKKNAKKMNNILYVGERKRAAKRRFYCCVVA